MTKTQRRAKLTEIIAAEKALPPPPLTGTVNVAAKVMSVTDEGIELSFTDPASKRTVITEKSLTDLFDTEDKLAVVVDRGTNEVVGIKTV